MAAVIGPAVLAVDFGLVVLIWLVQLVVYPSFAFVSEDRFAAFHAAYTRRVSFVVIPLMVGQVGLHAAIVTAEPSALRISAAALAGAAWVLTFALAVPCHRDLAGGKSDETIRRLVFANAWRTAVWSLAFLATLGASLAGGFATV